MPDRLKPCTLQMTPAAALEVSKQFYHAFELCRGNGLTTFDGKQSADIPSVVNLAFAIELALKASLLGYPSSTRGASFRPQIGRAPQSNQQLTG